MPSRRWIGAAGHRSMDGRWLLASGERPRSGLWLATGQLHGRRFRTQIAHSELLRAVAGTETLAGPTHFPNPRVNSGTSSESD